MYADDGLVFPLDSGDVKVEDKERGVSQNIEKSGWVKRDGIWVKPLKFLGLELLPAPDGGSAVIRAATRSGSIKEFGLNEMFMVYLMNERDLMFWAVNGFDNEESVEALGENVVFIREKKFPVLIKELLYGSEREKIMSGDQSIFEVENKHLRSIVSDLANRVTVPEWIRNASERFSQLKTPQKLLLEASGLSELAQMFITESESREYKYLGSQLTCSRKSWSY